MKQCDANLDRFDCELPKPSAPLPETMEHHGITRRQFLTWASAVTAALMLPPLFSSRVARAAENINRQPVIWLHAAECTGCTESFLRADDPGIDQLMLDSIDLEYHETLMAPCGAAAEKTLADTLEKHKNNFICIIEGALPTAQEGRFLTLGSGGKTGIQMVQEVSAQAAAVISLGSCASFGNLQAAAPNPTGSKSISEALGITTLNLPGCPPNPVNIIGVIVYYILFGKLPPLDSMSRPVFAYGKTVHTYCERLEHFTAGEFVEQWDDEGARKGWCLFKMGCKGYATYNNCSRALWNQHESWPVRAGHGCIGCSQPDFWDQNSPLYTFSTSESQSVRTQRYTSALKQLGITLDSATAKGLGLQK